MFLFAFATQGSPSATQPENTFTDVIRGWHHDLIDFIQKDLPKLLFYLLIAFLLLRIILFFVNKMRRLADRHAITNPQRASQVRTVASILRATGYGIIGFIVLLHVLSMFNINTTSLLASAGVVGVGIGLGAQSLFKDMLNGIFILIENQFNVGDNVKIASLAGTVEDLTLRMTTLRDGDGTLYFIPNSQIATVSNMSRDYTVGNLAVVVDASADPDKVLQILRKTATDVRNEPAFQPYVSDPVIPGIDTISGRSVTYPISVRAALNKKDDMLRELRRRILLAFEDEGIPLGTDPANLLLAHRAAATSVDPTAPPAQQPLTAP
jgi:moderate conductance mechanosensitive channel